MKRHYAVTNCSSCGAYHGEMLFDEFKIPRKVGDYDYRYWAICPQTGEPILARMDAEEDKLKPHVNVKFIAPSDDENVVLQGVVRIVSQRFAHTGVLLVTTETTATDRLRELAIMRHGKCIGKVIGAWNVDTPDAREVIKAICAKIEEYNAQPTT